LKQNSERAPFQGTIDIVKFNSHQYASAASFCILALLVVYAFKLHFWIDAILISLTVVVIFWTASSLVVSYLVYDKSPLYRADWLREVIGEPPRAWANIHAGLDDFSERIALSFGQPRHVWEIFDEKEMTEPSLRRAREIHGTAPGTHAESSALPCDDGSLDAIFLIFVAHELRRRQTREEFFSELCRCMAPGARLVLVEHMRDVANFLAFGPGCCHFWPRKEWLRLAVGAGLSTEREMSITPFVRAFVFRKAS